MEWPKRARTADWENGVLALDKVMFTGLVQVLEL